MNPERKRRLINKYYKIANYYEKVASRSTGSKGHELFEEHMRWLRRSFGLPLKENNIIYI